jgi:hypothetical protein
MELRDFIKTTLTEITLGVMEAQKETKDTGVIINPSGLGVGNKGDKYLRNDGWRYVQEIEINVGLTISETEGAKAGLGVITGLFSGGIANSNDKNNSSVTSIKFTIPVALPATETPKEYQSEHVV